MPPASSDPKDDLITVGKPEDDQKAVWDQHPNHPANYEQAAGEVFISDMRPYSVYRSPGIQQKLGERPPALRELSESQQSARTSAYEEQQAEVKKQQDAAKELSQASGGTGTPIVSTAQAPKVEVRDEAEASAEMQQQQQPRPSGGPSAPRPSRRS